jgi:hypothetical protein
MIMRNRLLIGFAYAAVTFMTAAPAAAQIEVQRHPDASWTGSRNDADDEGERAASDEGERDVTPSGVEGYQDYRPFGFSVSIQGGGSSNEYGPYGYPERGYGAFAQRGYRSERGSSLRAAYDYGRRDGYDAGFGAARDGRSDWRNHRYYRSTRGYDRRFGTRDAYDVNYRNGFRSGYEQGYRDGRRRRRY